MLDLDPLIKPGFMGQINADSDQLSGVQQGHWIVNFKGTVHRQLTGVESGTNR